MFTLPAGYRVTLINQGGDSTVDSDADLNNYTTILTELIPGRERYVVGYGSGTTGIHRGDLVWFDVNANGIQDAGETGIGSVTVDLYRVGSASRIDTTQTNASGNYLFTNLIPGTYYVDFTIPSRVPCLR